MFQRKLEGASKSQQLADMNDLEKKIIAVEVKAKKTSYLNSLVGNFKIHANSKHDLPQLSNLNKDLSVRIKDQQLITLPKATSQRGLLPSSDGNEHQDVGVYQKYRGFNVDLQMFPQKDTADLTKLFYGDESN